MGALSRDLFTIIVAMAVATTMAMPPMLRWALARLPLRPDEKARIEREEFEARGFVSNIERLLVAIDPSENGQFASRLAGLLSGSRRIPSTVLQLDSGPPSTSGQERPVAGETADAIIKDTAGAAEIESAHAGGTASAPRVDITTLLRREPMEEAIAGEAKKGYDMLLLGVESVVGAQGEIDEKVARVSHAFEGPLAIAIARGSHREEPVADTPLNILVPITGTEHSRRGAEVALSLARASLGSVTVLYVARSGRRSRRHGMVPRFNTNWPGIGTHEEAILREAVRLGDRFGVPLRTAIRVHADPEEAILQQLRIGEHNLIVMGVSPRPGTTLFFGDAAAAVLKRSHRSILLVAS
jgi:nucleotide-binding universal stress UspA family protein